MIRALMLSLQSLSDGKVISVLIKTILLSLVIFTGAGILLWFLIDWLLVKWGWATSDLSAIAVAIFMIMSGILLFRVVAIAVLWIFSDAVVDAVERKHYPQYAAHVKYPGTAQSAGMALRSVRRVLGYNLLALPVYAILLVTGVGTAIAFLLINALLLGRDLEDMLIARHGSNHATMGKIQRFMLGLLGTAGMLVPFVNLLVPVVATALAVHMTHMTKTSSAI